MDKRFQIYKFNKFINIIYKLFKFTYSRDHILKGLNFCIVNYFLSI